jgi:hypothetical protein
MHVADDGTLSFFGESGHPAEPAHIEVGKAYLRPAKGLKVLTRAIADPAGIQLDLNQLIRQYKFLVAVDTNTVEINGIRVSMAVNILIRHIVIDGIRWSAEVVQQDAFEFHDAIAAPERIGWCETIQRLAPYVQVHESVGLIVDSELGALRSINSRKQSVLGDFFLPENFTLLYGCGDRGTVEFIANASVAQCDKTASRLLERLQVDGLGGEYQRSALLAYGRFRYWPRRADFQALLKELEAK